MGLGEGSPTPHLRGLRCLPTAPQNPATERPVARVDGARIGRAPCPAWLNLRRTDEEMHGAHGGGPQGARSSLRLCLPLPGLRLSLAPGQELCRHWVPRGGLLEEEAQLD